jgi:hypothetical protein
MMAFRTPPVTRTLPPGPPSHPEVDDGVPKLLHLRHAREALAAAQQRQQADHAGVRLGGVEDLGAAWGRPVERVSCAGATCTSACSPGPYPRQ